MLTREFIRGKRVVLAEGTYQGTRGVFLQLRPDVNWADIEETSGVIRPHPMQWLRHTTGSDQP
jgi:hypothetical protein